ncbi:MAG: hypothetical protein JWO62_592 [Acidimicrobiaceae bacterium]|nr:hypothetical protein [Acidimicrobiaceae bacterium]
MTEMITDQTPARGRTLSELLDGTDLESPRLEEVGPLLYLLGAEIEKLKDVVEVLAERVMGGVAE